MTHTHFREALALELYAELDADERAALDAHLHDCADCRAYAVELREGLGRTGRAAPGAEADDLPAGWRVALQSELRSERAPALVRRLVPLAASFAAGLIVAVLVLRSAPATSPDRGGPLADRPLGERPVVAAPFEADARPLPALHRSRPGWLAAVLAR